MDFDSRLTEQAFSEARAELLRQIEDEARMTARYTRRAAFKDEVMVAMAKVLRHRFVPIVEQRYAYYDQPLPIGHGQTISQPYIVALMTDLLDVDADSKVLEIGTGCGYQAAVLAEIAASVYTLERVQELAEAAGERLMALGYANVHVKAADGYFGWPEHAPYDGIVVTAAAPSIPPALVEQLKPGGRLVIPLGTPYGEQWLVRAVREADGGLRSEPVLPVAFVPFLH